MSDRVLAGRSVVVTGGAGFIGSHLVEGLLEAGAGRVLIVDDLSLGRVSNLRAALGRPEVRFAQVDCTDLLALRAVVEDGPWDLCFGLAVLPLPHSLEYPRENVDRNVAMTTVLCELHRQGLFGRLVHYSSSEVYGSAETTPMSERHPLKPHTPYAAAKAATDLVVLSYARTFALESVIIRPFNTYGERQNDGAYAALIPVVTRRVLAGKPVEIHGDGQQTRDMTHVSDTVAGTLLAAVTDNVVGEVFNLGYGAATSVNDMVVAILDALGRPNHPVEYVKPRPGDVETLLADTSKARQMLGYAPQVELAEGIRRTVDWYLASSSPAVG